jgi:hypothetical protein
MHLVLVDHFFFMQLISVFFVGADHGLNFAYVLVDFSFRASVYLGQLRRAT